MTNNIYDYTRIIDFEGYDSEPTPNRILHSTSDSSTISLLNSKVFSKFRTTITMGIEYASTLSEAHGKNMVNLNLTKPDGTTIDLGTGNRISSSELPLYYEIVYEWSGFPLITLDNNGINKVYIEHKILG